MEGGNGVREANGITHSPTGEQNDEKCAYQTDEAENLHGWRLSRAPLLVQEKTFT